MKTLKTAAVLLFTMALFFSCAQETISNYGTLVIKPSGSSARVIAQFENSTIKDLYTDFEKDLTYTFECINEAAPTVTDGPYEVGNPLHDVQIPLLPGDWDVWVIVKKNEKEIGSEKYPETITIIAGQTVILGGIDVYVNTQGYSYGSAVASRAPDGFDYEDVDNPVWSSTPPININRHLDVDDGKTKTFHFDPNMAHGTAKILWDNQNLYVLVLVVKSGTVPFKTNSEKSGNEHHTDSVEIFLSEDGTSGKQYRIDYSGQKSYGYYSEKDGYTNHHYIFPTNGSLGSADSVTLEIKDKQSFSYAVIAKVPFKDPKNKDAVIGIDLQINGAPISGESNRSSVAVWKSELSPYRDPSLYKETLTLVE